MSFPNLKFIDSTVDYFENFVKDVLQGGDVNQKNHLVKRLQKFVNLHNFGKRPLDSEQTESHQLNKKLKRNNVELPNEMWIKIMNYLDTGNVFGNFSLTCKSFHNLTSAIKWLNMKDITNANEFQNVVKVLRRSTTLIKLGIYDSDNFVNKLVKEALKASRKLQTIIWYNKTSIKDDQSYLPLEIVEEMKKSGSEIAILYFDHINLSPKVMIEISKIKSLKELEVSQKLTPEVIDALASNSNQLESFISNQFQVYGYFNANEIKESLGNFFKEKKMTLKRLNMDLKFKIMEPLRNLNLCQNLEKLTVSMDAQDLHIISKLQKLKSLTLFEISAQNSLPDIKSFLNTTNLTYLSFQDCDFTREVFLEKWQL